MFNKDNKNKKIVVVEAKPISGKTTELPNKTENIRIDKIGELTLNYFAKPLKDRYEKHYKKDKIHLLVDLILGAIVLILLGVLINLFFFSRLKLINVVDFNVSSYPATLINGQEAEFTINYTNTTKETLTDATLVLQIPTSLHKAEYNLPDFDLKTNTFKIGDLAPKSQGQFKVKGFLLGNLHTKQEFLAVINYDNQYGQKRQEFFRQDFELNGSALQASLTFPKRVIATSPFATNVYVKNTAGINYDNVKIKMVWPKSITFISTPLGQAVNQAWNIGDYQANAENNFEFRTKAYVSQPQNVSISAQFYATYDKNEYLLAESATEVFVDFSKLKMTFINLENNQSINPGGEGTYTFIYKNEENYSLNNVEMFLEGRGEFGGNQSAKASQKNYPQLAKIEAGAEGTISLPLTAKANVEFTNDQEKNYQFEILAVASYDDPVEKSRISVESKPIYTAVNSHLTLTTTAYFYTPDGDQIGVGSVPPVVDEYTSYWIVLKLSNTINNLKDITVSAQVPDYIEFTDVYNVTEGNQIIYQADNHKLVWTISSINRFAGIFVPPPQARIQLAITPSVGQVGTSPALLTNISASATDEKTGAFLSAAGKNITTAIFPEPSLNKVIE